MFANEGESDTSVGLSHPFELGGKRAKRIALARTGIELARAELEDRTIRLVFRLRALFGDALAAAERVDLIERQEKLNQETLGVMEVRLRAGDASRLESSLLAASTRQLEAERVAVEDDLARVVLEVKTLAGMAPAEELVLRGTLELPPLAATRDGALEVALRERPDVRAARQREALADAGIEVARAQAIPNLSAFVRFGKENNVIEGLLPPREIIVEREKRLSFGLEIPLPLFNRQQGTIGEAISRRSQARAEREGVEAAARRDVLDAYRRYEAMRRVLELYTRGVLAESQESFRIVSLAYRLGELRLLDVLQQQRLHLDSQRGYASAKHAYYTAVVDLERAMGKWPLVEGSR
jgi:cobalt-zinc-cadmium efflux system outer membrane protein